jgi:nucleoside transporter
MQTRLSAMMFLEFFIWGGWFVTLGTYMATTLSASGAQTAAAYSTQSWGAIIAPFIVGLVADRYFNAERLLGIIHLVGGVLMFLLWKAQGFADFYPYLLGYMILYMPTLALVNSVAFRQLEQPAVQFGRIRVWGTLGWIIAGLVISYVFAWDSADSLKAGLIKNTFLMCSIASFVMGLYSFTLPATPPRIVPGQRTGLREVMGLDALALLKDRNFAIFFAASILICIPLAFYYQYANPFLTESHVANATGKQTLGQVSEVLFMLLIPIFLARVGMKGILLTGMLAWAARYVLFAYGDAGERVWMLILGIALHGACYDFFFVSGQIFTDSKAGERFKSSAQGLITLATYGVGMLIGFWAAGAVADMYTSAQGHAWRSIWLMPAAFAIVVSVLFALSFRNERLGLREAG